MDSVIPTQWIELFKGLDIAVLVMLSTIAFALQQAKTVTDAQRVLLLLSGGALWGTASAFGTYGADTPTRVLVGFILKGVLMNAGGAYIVSALARVVLEKAGVINAIPSSITVESKQVDAAVATSDRRFSEKGGQ